ncbi:hypothetical protein EPUS_00572 [Endocarpon pusillum Z07020]|uniref:Uncharacterized protein n=1 Tax=Endocarpon pusillum (strain Z07020 / HMAS-L-300199) TaxID=1263415 RepID=U1GHI7_ENDPU|nr:uncharacterized protein EPUS_00572 [Endocarpon pusillum Z07020]ERF71583.1 hypothetical protein EPUS_00572 [Endocarpon pusillum Z07020]
MPHKHKRQRRDEGASFDLPPTSIAKSLPAFHRIKPDDERKRKRKHDETRANADGSKVTNLKDDTPRAFARLLNYQKIGKQPAHTLDDGITVKGIKRKRDVEDTTKTALKAKELPTATSKTATNNALDIKILPGERLGEFSARVDQALPITGLRTKGQTGSIKIPGIKAEERKTKHNRRLERMQKQWREEESRRKAKLEEEMEEKEDEREEQQLLWGGVKAGRKKGKKRIGEKNTSGEDEDPWAELEEKRRDSRQKNLQDVVQAPPQLKGVKGKFKDYVVAGVDVGDVPGRVGSLRKREEIGSARRKVIEEYRKITRRKNQVNQV